MQWSALGWTLGMLSRWTNILRLQSILNAAARLIHRHSEISHYFILYPGFTSLAHYLTVCTVQNLFPYSQLSRLPQILLHTRLFFAITMAPLLSSTRGLLLSICVIMYVHCYCPISGFVYFGPSAWNGLPQWMHLELLDIAPSLFRRAFRLPRFLAKSLRPFESAADLSGARQIFDYITQIGPIDE